MLLVGHGCCGVGDVGGVLVVCWWCGCCGRWCVGGVGVVVGGVLVVWRCCCGVDVACLQCGCVWPVEVGMWSLDINVVC